MEQRIRSDYQIVAKPITKEGYPISCSAKHWQSTGTAGYYLTGSRRLMLDYVIPRFHQRQKAGEKFFNDMYKEEITVSDAGSGCLFTSVANFCPDGTKAQTRIGSGYVALLTPRVAANDHGHSLPLLATSLDASEILRVKRAVSTETWSKIGTGSSELWESAAEYRQVLSLLENPLTRLKDLSSRLLNSAQRSSLSRGLMKEVSDGYLLYRYGISPLMKDIKDAIAGLSKAGGHKEVTSRAKEQISNSKVFVGVTDNDGLTSTWQCQTAHSVVVRGMHLDSGYVSFANNLGFDFKGLMLLPLQLTSYSFVADWFVNLSSYVKSTIPAFGWNPLGGCLVTTEAISTAYTLSNVTVNDTGQVLTGGPSGSAAIVSMSTTRSPLLDPALTLNSDFKFDKATRVGDALGLIASRFVKIGSLMGFRPNNSAFHDKKAYQRWADQAHYHDF
jgi:hypothetical protein